MATKKVGRQNFFPSPLLLLLPDPRSEMEKNQDPGSGINLLVPQRCIEPLVHHFFSGCDGPYVGAG
jgi:hypothetical protein